MVYLPNIPQSNDNISSSQSQLLANFQALQNFFALDHNTWDAPNAGLHKQVTIVTNTGADPGAVGTTGVYYAKTVAGVTAPYFQNSVGPSVLWRGGSGNGLMSTPVIGNTNITFPNGLKMQWGLVGPVSAPGQTVNFATSFTTVCFAVQLTPRKSDGVVRSLYLNSFNTNNFTITTSAAPADLLSCYYFAIGV